MSSKAKGYDYLQMTNHFRLPFDPNLSIRFHNLPVDSNTNLSLAHWLLSTTELRNSTAMNKILGADSEYY